MEERYFNYFQEKLKKLPELRQHGSCLDNPSFDKWWGSIELTCEHMGDRYKQRADRISFFPGVLTDGDDSAWINRSYQSGLNQAEAFLETLMEELQTWGLDGGAPVNSPPSKGVTHGKEFNLFVTVSQQQAQQIIQTINLDDYDEQTKQKVNDLFEELRKENKDKNKISSVVKWLADKSVDALIAILLAKANFT